jgi:hypothetical protein
MYRLLVVACLAATALATPAGAQTYSTQPNGTGGWNTYGPNGYHSSTLPNGTGGFNTYGPNGRVTTTTPNGTGGFNSYTTPGYGPRQCSGFGSNRVCF